MKSEYEIEFSGLEEGHYKFNFKIGNTFFELFDYSDIGNADLSVILSLEKKSMMMLAEFIIEGTVNVMCDKCTDDFNLPISGGFELIYKFSDVQEDDEKIVCIMHGETHVDLKQPIYEFVTLLLPSRRIHSNGECNQEMLDAMDDYLMIEKESDNNLNFVVDSEKSEKEVDPRWSVLNKLKNN